MDDIQVLFLLIEVAPLKKNPSRELQPAHWCYMLVRGTRRVGPESAVWQAAGFSEKRE